MILSKKYDILGNVENVTVCVTRGSPRLAVGLEGPECNLADSDTWHVWISDVY